MYRKAAAVVKSDPGLPEGAVLRPRKEAEFFVAKNAASIHVPFEFTNEQGEKETDTYTVWLKRIARRWEIDRYQRSPMY